MELPSTGHDPVLMTEVLDYLAPAPGKVWVDCTLGRAGHALGIVEKLGPDGLFIGLDVDPHNLEYAQRRLADAPCAVRLFHANFAELDEVLSAAGTGRVDAVLADLGISTNQLFEQRYGLSFTQPMPLDMRIDPRLTRSAADLVNTLREEDLANVLYELAQERYSRRIARNIAEARRVSPILTTDRLAELCRRAYPPRERAPNRIDPATRTFLALRIVVNHELDNLQALLRQGVEALSAGGRFGVISFQSTEDRIVKQAFRSDAESGTVRILTRKPLIPSDEEAERNPRSRSSKMRVVEKLVVEKRVVETD